MLVTVISCKKDEIVEEVATHQVHNEDKQGFISLDIFEQHIGESTEFTKNSAFFDVNMREQIQGRSAEFIGAYVVTDEIHLIETQTINYYTLKLVNNNPNERANIFYNLVFEQNLNTGIVTSSILQYNPKLSWLLDKSKMFQGETLKYDNTIITLTDLNNNAEINDRAFVPSCTFASGGWHCSGQGHPGPGTYDGVQCGGNWEVNLMYAPCSQGPGSGGGPSGDNDGNNGSNGSGGDPTQTVVLELCNGFLPDGEEDAEDCEDDYSEYFTPYLCAYDNPNDIHDWVENNHPQATAMANFLANNYSQDDSNNCVEIDFEELVIEDPSFEDTDTDCIHNKMKENSNNIYANMFSNFNGTTGKILDLKIADIPSGEWGITRGNDADGNSYTLTIDDDINTDGSNLMKYVTLCHEMIHAYMFSTLEDLNLITFLPNGEPKLEVYYQDGVELNSLTIEDRFTTMICALSESGTLTDEWSHELFNTTVFDPEEYRQQLENFLVNEHDWDGESQAFRDNAQDLFGAT